LPSVAIVHNRLDILGGGERLCLATIETFKERGWKVILGTIDRTDWDRVLHLWGRIPKPDEEIVLSIPIKGFTIYKRLLASFLIPRLREKADVILDTYGDLRIDYGDITYIHFPTFALWDTSYTKYEHGFWRIYFAPFYLTQKLLIKRRINTMVLTNSRFSATVIRRFLGRNALVVHPPVNVEKYLLLDGKRENTVVTVGRFSHEKRYEFVVDVAEKMPDTQFYIIGAISGSRESKKYYEKIRRLIEEKDLKNIELVPNAPEKKMLKILGSAKVYLHAMVSEHFGLSVAEGMAAGLVPVIHKSGGAWTDIVEFGRYGFGYSDTDEAVRSIGKALREYPKLIPRIRRSVLRFSKEKYKERIFNLVKKYVEKTKGVN